MLKKILYGILFVALGIMALFMVDSAAFDSFVEKQKGNDMNIPVNQNAPVLSKDEIDIAAPAEKIWGILADIENWPKWQSEVTEARLTGDMKEGAVFKWKAGGLSFESRIHTMKPAIKLGWTGKTIGAYAVHNWFFEERDGKTIVRVEESLQGIFPRLFRGYFQNNLDLGVKKNLLELKKASE